MKSTVPQEPLTIYKNSDCDLGLIQPLKIAVVGYGSQGHAHALNLRDSGAECLVVALRDGSASAGDAQAAGLQIESITSAVQDADIVMLLMPDEAQPALYNDILHEHMKQGAALGFAHGLNIHFGQITPRVDLDVFMVAPKGPGTAVRSEYELGRGLPCLMAVAQDVSGNAKDIALSYAASIGCGRSGIIETSFKDECETDLFGEQAVLCGGIPALVQAGFETLVEAGYPPEMAYFECIHEAKLITDLIYERGISNMYKAVSNTAEYGGYSRGARIVTDDTKAEMRRILSEIQNGDFVREYMGGNAEGLSKLPKYRAEKSANPVEAAGRAVRKLLPWLGKRNI